MNKFVLGCLGCILALFWGGLFALTQPSASVFRTSPYLFVLAATFGLLMLALLCGGILGLRRSFSSRFYTLSYFSMVTCLVGFLFGVLFIPRIQNISLAWRVYDIYLLLTVGSILLSLVSLGVGLIATRRDVSAAIGGKKSGFVVATGLLISTLLPMMVGFILLSILFLRLSKAHPSPKATT